MTATAERRRPRGSGCVPSDTAARPARVVWVTPGPRGRWPALQHCAGAPRCCARPRHSTRQRRPVAARAGRGRAGEHGAAVTPEHGYSQAGVTPKRGCTHAHSSRPAAENRGVQARGGEGADRQPQLGWARGSRAAARVLRVPREGMGRCTGAALRATPARRSTLLRCGAAWRWPVTQAPRGPLPRCTCHRRRPRAQSRPAPCSSPQWCQTGGV